MTALRGGRGDQDDPVGVGSIMARGVADVRIPADMLDRAVRGNRKRTARHRLLGAASVVAAAATAAAVVLTLPGGTVAGKARAAEPPAQAGPRAQAGTYVLARATEAQANTRTMISVAHASDGTFYTDVATQQQRYDAGLRASNGQPYFQWEDTVSNGTWTETMVVNQDRVYSVQTASSSAGLTISSLLPLQGQSDPVAAFSTALKQGLVKVVGHQELDGRDTILLRYSSRLKSCGAANPAICARKAAMGTASLPPDDEVWLDASTYLVTRIQNYAPTGAITPGKPVKWSPEITTVNWLPATASNLALLAIAPPQGYAKVPPADMVKYLGPIS